MDLLKLPARWLAGPAAAVLGVEGRDRRERAENFRTPMTAAPVDELDLVERHLAQFVLWWLVGLVVLPVAIVVQVVLATLNRDDNIASTVAWGVVAFCFWMGVIHAAKGIVANYLLTDRWRPDSRLGRITMLDQLPDIVVALTVTVILQVLVLR
jgi:hypothetical protein